MKEMFTATLPCKEINHAKSDYWQRQKIPKQKLKKCIMELLIEIMDNNRKVN